MPANLNFVTKHVKYLTMLRYLSNRCQTLLGSVSRSYHTTWNELPRITCPKKIEKKIEKHKEKKLAKVLLSRRQARHSGPLIVSCKRKGYNHYQGDSFNEFDIQKLVSCGWKNKKRIGDHFTLMPFSDNPSIETEEICSFPDLGINEKVNAGLKEIGIQSPTKIQKSAIPVLLQGQSAICAAETGSGKTLAYILPAIEWILQYKRTLKTLESGVDSKITNINCPNTIVLTPNRELTLQVMAIAESLTKYADFTPFTVTGHEAVLERKILNPMDMLITTPGALKKLLKRKSIHCNFLQHMVIDESDTLFDDSFAPDMHEIFRMSRIQPADETDKRLPLLIGTQIVLVSATMPVALEKTLGEFLPLESMVKVSTQGLHHLQPHVKQTFLRINNQRKPEKLIELVKLNIEKNHPTIVFANNNKTCYFVHKLLGENGVECLQLSGEMLPKERRGVFEKFRDGFCNVLVATDIASRGLDTVNVQHVINYDFPTFISDYIHRVGRVGRVGGTDAGEVTSLISEKWNVELVWKIEIAARKRRKLRDVNANIKQKLDEKKMKMDKFELNII
ncbi:unnamed protein product [Lymnaea stagnalis]|uniref:RNA helicase n=1 Tax=Lymnaea stagnalis TaxID=6523 RepID=A0AAV2HKK7_LYMST